MDEVDEPTRYTPIFGRERRRGRLERKECVRGELPCLPGKCTFACKTWQQPRDYVHDSVVREGPNLRRCSAER